MTTDFSDNEHLLAGVSLKRAVERDLAATCNAELLAAIEVWAARAEPHAPGVADLQLARTSGFSVTYDGQCSDYWPDRDGAFVEEMLIRQLLYPQGICTIDDARVRVYAVAHGTMGMDGVDHLLVAPYRTAAGNIGGIVVVTIDRYLRDGVDRVNV